jgi:colanic acid/amylovoran biosynthesis glycosyltransferase
MSNLRIGIFVEAFPVISETFVFQKVKALLALGYDIQIFTLTPRSDWQNYQTDSVNIDDLKRRIHCAYVNDPLHRKIFRFIKLLFIHPVASIYWIIFNIRFSENKSVSIKDKIFSRINFFNIKLDLLSVEFDTLGYKIVDLKEYLGCKVVSNTRGIAQSTGTFRKNPTILSLLNHYSDYYCFASHFLRENSYKLGMSSDIPSKVIYGSVSEKFQNVAYKERAFNKPIIDAVAALRVEGYDVRYTVVGEGPYKEAIINCANFYGFLDANVVTIVGSKDTNQIINYLLNSDIFLQGSLSEGFGISIVEAQYTGIPIVCSDAGGLPENIINNTTGLLFQRRNSEEMRTKIKQLINDPTLANNLGHTAYVTSRTNYSPKREIFEIEGVFREVI